MTLLPIFKKEFRSYFNSPIAYIFIGVFLVVSGWLFWQRFFLVGQAQMRSFFSLLPWLFLFLIPALSMRLWSEEKKQGTMELLLTLPIRDFEIVLAKFLAAMGFLTAALGLTLPLVFTVARLGDIDSGAAVGGYLGALFIGAFYLSLGEFISSLTKNQIVAFLLSTVFLFVAFILGQDYVLMPFSGSLAVLFNFLSPAGHYNNLIKGVLDLRDIFYFLSFIFYFLFLNVKVLESRFYKG